MTFEEEQIKYADELKQLKIDLRWFDDFLSTQARQIEKLKNYIKNYIL